MLSIETDHVFDYRARFRRPVAVGRHPYGTRLSYELDEGRLRGPRVSGEVLSSGNVQWAEVDEHGWTRIDVRGQCLTEDGALLYISGAGLIEPGAQIADAIRSGAQTVYEDQYWRTALSVESNDPRYRWLTRSVLVGRGRICDGPGVEYQVFRVR